MKNSNNNNKNKDTESEKKLMAWNPFQSLICGMQKSDN